MEPVEITAGRLHLRPWQPADAGVLAVLAADPEVRRWTPWLADGDVAGFLDRDARRWEDGTGAELAVLDAVRGEVVGAVGLYGIEGGQARIGWLTAPEARRQAVGPDAVRALARWAFHGLHLGRLTADIEVGNWASRGVAERCGFLLEGTLRQVAATGGRRVDAWLLARLAGDPERDTAPLPRQVDLTDARVRLRRWRLADAAEVARACDNPEIARWLPVPSPYTLADAQFYLGTLVPTSWANGTGANVAVVDRQDRLLGAVGLKMPLREDGVGEVGYWTAPWARGQGVARRAAALLGRWGLDELGLGRIELLADVENLASQRAAEAAGYLREGVMRAARRDPRNPGAPRRDMVLFSLR